MRTFGLDYPELELLPEFPNSKQRQSLAEFKFTEAGSLKKVSVARLVSAERSLERDG